MTHDWQVVHDAAERARAAQRAMDATGVGNSVPDLFTAAQGLQKLLFDECEQAEWDPDRTNSFGDETAHLHEEVSEAFRAYRKSHGFGIWFTCSECDAIVSYDAPIADVTPCCQGRFKPQGVPIEHADVLIGMFYNAQLNDYDLIEATRIKHEYNLTRSYEAEGRRVHQ